jgi:hypothetical protein
VCGLDALGLCVGKWYDLDFRTLQLFGCLIPNNRTRRKHEISCHITSYLHISWTSATVMARGGKGQSKSGGKGRKGWTTEEQALYLESCKALYLTAQSTKKTSEFWPPVWEQWFEQWPTVLTDQNIEDGKTMAGLQSEMKTVSTSRH